MGLTIPDILCLVRGIFAFGLFLLEPLSDGFLIYYAALCLTDVFDGRIARWRGINSGRGAALDSACDAVLCVVMLICVLPHIEWKMWMIWGIVLVASMRLFSLGFGTGKFGSVAFVHTYMNKLSGLLMYLLPFLLYILDVDLTAAIVITVTTLAASEYLYINLTSDSLDRDYRGMLFGHR